MNEESFNNDYKNVKKKEIIKELYYKCKANRNYFEEIVNLRSENEILKQNYFMEQDLTKTTLYIIHSLDKWLNYFQDEVIKDKGTYAQDLINQSYYEGKIDGIQVAIDKLKELKEIKHE